MIAACCVIASADEMATDIVPDVHVYVQQAVDKDAVCCIALTADM